MSAGRAATLVSVADRLDFTSKSGEGIEFRNSLTGDDFSEIFSITKTNMEALYNSCGSADWAWDDAKKAAELRHKKSRFLIVRDSQTKKVLGFICFRFMVEAGSASLYVWEIQVRADGEHQGKGIGSKLMAAAEKLLVKETGIRKVFLTVLRNNERAIKFYQKLGYTVDKSSPPNVCYSIFSKSLRG